MLTRQNLDATFAVLVAKAVAGERCPQRGRINTDGLNSAWVVELAHAGRIRIEISGQNYRTVEILKGPHKGKTTAPDPHRSRPWKIIDQNGTRTLSGSVRSPPRKLPSAPRLLPYAGKEKL